MKRMMSPTAAHGTGSPRRFALVAAAVSLTGVVCSLAWAGEPPAKADVAAAARSAFPVAAKRAKSPGELVFLAKCQYCHVEMGPGTITLAKRVGPDRALLTKRTDLSAEYVKTIVRHGINTMPAINRVEVSDAELEQIAAYLSRSQPEAGTGKQ